MNILKYFKSFTQRSEKQLQEIQLTQQHMSHIIALLLVMLFFIFMSGYYWGKKTALEHFTTQLENDSLADKVSYAFCSLYDSPEGEETESQTQEAGNLAQTATNDKPITAPIVAQQEAAQTAQIPVHVNASANISKDAKADTHIHEYIAQLAGFGAQRTARSYAQMLNKKGFDVKIVERKSTTARGKQTFWYQVITPAFTDKDKLLEMIDSIKKVSPLKDVKIVSVDISNKV